MHEGFAPNVVCALARIRGITVGLVANQPLVLAGAIDIDASSKAARFVGFCDAFHLPIVSLVDVPGFARDRAGTRRNHPARAKLIFVFAARAFPGFS